MWTITNTTSNMYKEKFTGDIPTILYNTFIKSNKTITIITSEKLGVSISIAPLTVSDIQITLTNNNTKKVISQSLLYNIFLMPNNTKPLEELIKLYIQTSYSNYNKKALLSNRLKITYIQ